MDSSTTRCFCQWEGFSGEWLWIRSCHPKWSCGCKTQQGIGRSTAKGTMISDRCEWLEPFWALACLSLESVQIYRKWQWHLATVVQNALVNEVWSQSKSPQSMYSHDGDFANVFCLGHVYSHSFARLFRICGGFVRVWHWFKISVWFSSMF